MDIFERFGVSPNEYDYDPISDTIRRKENTFNERWALPVQPPMDIIGDRANLPTMIAPANPNIYGLPVEYQKPLIELEDNRLFKGDYQVSSGNKYLNKLFGTDQEEERFQTWPERMARSGVALPADVYEGRTPIESVTEYPGSVSPSYTQMEPRAIPKMLGMGNFTVPGSESAIARAQDTAGLAGMGGIGLSRAAAVDASLGSTPYLRPALKHEGKIYKGKQGEEHPVPEHLRSDFEQKAMSGEDISHYNFGFVNHKGQFLTREKALEYAVEQGLVPPETARYGTLTTTMLEDSRAATAIAALNKKWEDKGVRNFIAEQSKAHGSHIKLHDLVVPKEQRGQGIGSEFMQDLINLADKEGKTIVLTAAKDYGATSVNRLKDFYKEFGFVENKGRNKDFRISDNMYRKPVLLEDSRAATGLGAINQSGFYSNLERTIASSKLQKGTPEEWTAYLKNQPGIKAEEMEFALSGLPNKQLTKVELEAHIAENGVRLGEVWKGVVPEELKGKWNELLEKEAQQIYGTSYHLLPLSKRNTITDNVEKIYAGNDPKYSSYQLPGGENYRELLLTVPNRHQIKAEEYAKQFYNDNFRAGAENVKTWEELSPYDRNRWIEAAREQQQIGRSPEDYRSSHWDEPNVLAHIRMNDRVIGGEIINKLTPEIQNISKRIKNDGRNTEPHYWTEDNIEGAVTKGNITQAEADKLIQWRKENPFNEPYTETKGGLKTLHIEEIQSDWHQAGRKQGYNVVTKPFEVVENNNGTYSIRRPDGQVVNNYRTRQEAERDAAIVTEHAPSSTRVGVPNAPFKKSWDELALKRAITEAVKNNHDAISWTPGEAQAARYDLSKQIERIHFTKTNDGQYLIAPEGIGGREVPVNSGQAIPANKLADYVGKEVADKIVQKAENTKPYEPITELPEGYTLIHDSNGKAKGEEWGILPPGQKHAGSMTGRYLPTEEAAIKAALDKINSEKRYKYDRDNSVLENVDLKIGGEGMKAFYDKMLVDKANSLVKKMGGKVEYEHLPVTQKQKDAIRKEYTEGKLAPDEIAQKKYEGEWKELVALRDEHWQTIKQRQPDNKAYDAAYQKYKMYDDMMDELHNKMIMDTLDRKLKELKGEKIPIIRITPAMREKIAKEGFPLFTAPQFIPVDSVPDFGDNRRLVPVEGNPFQ